MRIAIIEPQLIIRFFLSRSLERLGHDVVCPGGDWSTAAPALAVQPPDLIIAEVNTQDNLLLTSDLFRFSLALDIPVICSTTCDRHSIKDMPELKSWYVAKPYIISDITQIIDLVERKKTG